MSEEAIARLVEDSDAHNTIASRTIEVFFQRSAGVATNDVRGIVGLQWRVMSDGVEVQTGTTEDDGLVEVEIRGSTETILQLLHEGTVVSEYPITINESGYEPDTELIGIQRRLRQIGYQLGWQGDQLDGIDGEMRIETDRAIQDFQIDKGLEFDSIVGRRTRGALNREVGGSAAST